MEQQTTHPLVGYYMREYAKLDPSNLMNEYVSITMAFVQDMAIKKAANINIRQKNAADVLCRCAALLNLVEKNNEERGEE